jgi:hypothetical protein
MSSELDYLGWAAAVAVLPAVAVTMCVVLVALAAVVARKPATRRHYLSVIQHLTEYVGVLRNKR